MKTKTKYKTTEEKKQANREAAKKWYYNHKDNADFKQKRNEYHRKYYGNLKEVKKEALKAYNTDYAFYIKNIRTGKFELRIAKTKEQVQQLTEKLKHMQDKFAYLKDKFGHLELKNVNRQ